MIPELFTTIPATVTAAADVAAAIENGVAMRRSKSPENSPTAPALAAPAGISGADFLTGMMLLALALLGAAVIIRSGLVA
jgi:hypothetical protein